MLLFTVECVDFCHDFILQKWEFNNIMAIPFTNERLLVLLQWEFIYYMDFKHVSRMIFAYSLGRAYSSFMRAVLHGITIKLFLK